MELTLTIGVWSPPAELLGQAASLQAFFRKAAETKGVKYRAVPATSKNNAVAVIQSEDGDRIVLYINASDQLDSEDRTSAETVAKIIAEAAEMLGEIEFDSEVVVKPFRDDFAGTEGYSAFWTPKGGEEVRANITAFVHPPTEMLMGCGDPRKLLEMEEDPDWIPRHDLQAGFLRYADYSRARIVQFSVSDVKEWMAKGRISPDDLTSLPEMYLLRAK